MAVVGNVQTLGNLTGLAGGVTDTFNDTQPFAGAVGQTSIVTLTTGANTVTVPTGTTYVRIYGPNAANPQPNPSFGGTLTLKGVAGDTGIPVSAKYPTSFAWDSTTAAPASFVVNASSGTTITVLFW